MLSGHISHFCFFRGQRSCQKICLGTETIWNLNADAATFECLIALKTVRTIQIVHPIVTSSPGPSSNEQKQPYESVVEESCDVWYLQFPFRSSKTLISVIPIQCWFFGTLKYLINLKKKKNCCAFRIIAWKYKRLRQTLFFEHSGFNNIFNNLTFSNSAKQKK